MSETNESEKAKELASFLLERSDDFNQRGRVLHDTAAKYVFGLNGGGIGVVFALVGAMRPTVIDSSVLLPPGLFVIGLLLVGLRTFMNANRLVEAQLLADRLRADLIRNKVTSDEAMKQYDEELRQIRVNFSWLIKPLVYLAFGCFVAGVFAGFVFTLPHLSSVQPTS